MPSSTLATLSRMASGGVSAGVSAGVSGGESHTRGSTLFALTVTQDKFHVRLKSSSSRRSGEKYPVVSGFDLDEQGCAGEVQASGRVLPGDFLKSVNGVSLYNRPFKQCVSIIRQASQGQGSKELTFFRLEEQLEEEPGWQTKSPVYASYSREVLSALKDRADLDINIAREFSKLGLPDEDGVRSVMWKVLLGFLPPEASCWDESLARSRASYQDLLSELIVNPQAREDPQPLPPRSTQRKRQQTFTTSSSPPSSPDHSLALTSQSNRVPAPPLFSSPPPAAFTGKTGTKQTQLVSLLDAVCSNPSTESVPQFKPASVCRMREVTACRVSDDPLSQATGSAWKGYWEDWLLYESIEKDVIRTYPCLHFFAEESGTHYAALQRILYLYAKLNPGIKYVQGMNELVGTLYYVFGNQMSYEPWREHVEADTFFCFSLLMIDVRDLFIRNLDDASCGIGGRIQDFVDTLKEHDPVVADLLDEQGIAPSFYSLRWITTLFTREFDLFDTIRLWDSLFADTDRHDLLCCLCCTMVMEQRDELLSGDFTSNLTLLQHYPPIHISYFLSRVENLRAKGKPRKNRNRNSNWNGSGSGNTTDTEQRTVDSPVEKSTVRAPLQPLMGHVISTLNDNQWLSGIRQSLFRGDASSFIEQRVPDFRICRNKDLYIVNDIGTKTSVDESARVDVAGDAPQKINGNIISFEEGDINDTENDHACSSNAVPVTVTIEEKVIEDEFEPMWTFGSPIHSTGDS